MHADLVWLSKHCIALHLDYEARVRVRVRVRVGVRVRIVVRVGFVVVSVQAVHALRLVEWKAFREPGHEHVTHGPFLN